MANTTLTHEQRIQEMTHAQMEREKKELEVRQSQSRKQIEHAISRCEYHLMKTEYEEELTPAETRGFEKALLALRRYGADEYEQEGAVY